MAATDRLRRTWPALLLLLLVGGSVYANTFQVPFFLDDEWAIVNNLYIKNPGFLTTPSLWFEQYAGRIVALWTFALNYRLGGLDVTGYHVVNLLIHLTAAMLIYALLRLTFRTPYFKSGSGGEADSGLGSTSTSTSTFFFLLAPHAFIPLFAALLFVAHPVQTQAVTYVVQRMTSLTAMFYLLSVVLYVQARLRLEARGARHESPVTSHGYLLFFAGSVLAALLAMKTKETAITLPLAIVLYELFFFRGGWKKRFFCLLPLLATLPVVPLTVFSPGQDAGEALAEVSSQVQVQTSLSRADYLFTQFRVIVTYLRLLILPVNQNLDYDYPVYTTFLTPPVFLSFLLLATIFVIALYLFQASGWERQVKVKGNAGSGESVSPESQPVFSLTCLFRLISFGILWFFLTLSVESSVIPIPDVIFEHRLYLPLFGAAAAFAAAVALAAERFLRPAAGRWLAVVAALTIAGLAIATFQRNQVWGSEIRLWQDVVAKSPGKVRAYNNLGVALNRAGRPAEAIEVLSRAIAMDPLHPDAYNNLGRAYITNGQSGAALPVLRTAIRIDPRFEGAYVNLAAALNQLRRFDETVSLVEGNLGLLGERVEAHYHLGVAYAFLGNREAARRQLEIVSRFGVAGLVADLNRLMR